MPLTIINWIFAFSPLLVLIFLMSVFKMGAKKAGLITWILMQLIAFSIFGANLQILTTALFKSFFLALDVLLIIWGAMYLYQVTKNAGTIQKIGNFLTSFTQNKAYLGIFLGWLFPSFLQGMGGFGVPVAVTAPLLMSVGFSPLTSILIPSIGHGWGVSFGSMGSSIRSMQAITNLPLQSFTPTSAILLGIAAIISGVIVAFISGGKRLFFKSLPLTLLSAAILSIGQYLIALTDFWVIAVTLPSLLSLIIGFILVGIFSSSSREWIQNLKRSEIKEILIAIIPYTLLVLLILFFYFFKPLRTFFQPLNFSISFPSTKTSMGFFIPAENSKTINIALHPGTILFITGLITYFLYKNNELLENLKHRKLLNATISSSRNTTIAIFALVGAAVTMRHAGMISLLAQGISAFFPRQLYPIVSPFIGALGAFITGSNNNSNVLFAGLQLETAQLLQLPVAWILAAQTTGAAIGSIMAPAKVILGCSTVGLDGEEGNVIGRLIMICLAIILIIGVSVYLFIN